MKVVIFGDVHGNARALRAALSRADDTAFDALVFIGDLLTYGHDVDEVIELVAAAQAKHRATLLIGNHDQMYFDLAAGDRRYYDKLPAWIRTSIDLTTNLLGDRALADSLVWSTEVVLDGVLFSHANPFGDWTYLNTDGDVARAREVLRHRSLRAGVFGHTHRPRWDRDAPAVINVGSVGQPRDGTGRSVIVRLDTETLDASFEPIDYDLAAHLAGLRATGLEPSTIERLEKFFAAQDAS